MMAMAALSASPLVGWVTHNPNSHASNFVFAAWGMYFLFAWWKKNGFTRAILAGLLLGGCATTGTEQEPLKVPSGALDYKPAPPRPAELDVQSRMTQFTTPDPVVDIKLYSFRSTGQPVNLALSQLATAYGLNVVVDQDVEGQVTVDLKQLPLEKVLEAILEPLGLAWTWEDGLLRVSRLETRTFNIDYLRLVRSGNGTSSSSVSLSSGGGGGGGSAGNSSSSVAQNDTINFWNELQEQLEAMLERSEEDYIGSERPVETTVQTDRDTHTRYVTTGRGYLSGQEATAHFGLGAATAVRKLTVRWPSHAVQEFQDRKIH